MDYSWLKEVLLPIITATAGLFIGNRLTTKTKNEEELAAFWHKYAITEGVEPVLNYLGNLSGRIERVRMQSHDGWDDARDSATKSLTQNLTAIPPPHVALHRLSQLTGFYDFPSVIMVGEQVIELQASKAQTEAAHSEVLSLMTFIGLLHVIFACGKITERQDIIKAHENPKIKEFVETFKVRLEEKQAESAKLVAEENKKFAELNAGDAE